MCSFLITTNHFSARWTSEENERHFWLVGLENLSLLIGWASVLINNPANQNRGISIRSRKTTKESRKKTEKHRNVNQRKGVEWQRENLMRKCANTHVQCCEIWGGTFELATEATGRQEGSLRNVELCVIFDLQIPGLCTLQDNKLLWHTRNTFLRLWIHFFGAWMWYSNFCFGQKKKSARTADRTVGGTFKKKKKNEGFSPVWDLATWYVVN